MKKIIVFLKVRLHVIEFYVVNMKNSGWSATTFINLHAFALLYR